MAKKNGTAARRRRTKANAQVTFAAQMTQTVYLPEWPWEPVLLVSGAGATTVLSVCRRSDMAPVATLSGPRLQDLAARFIRPKMLKIAHRLRRRNRLENTGP